MYHTDQFRYTDNICMHCLHAHESYSYIVVIAVWVKYSHNKRKHNMDKKWLSNVHVHIVSTSMLRECISG